METYSQLGSASHTSFFGLDVTLHHEVCFTKKSFTLRATVIVTRKKARSSSNDDDNVCGCLGCDRIHLQHC